MTRRSAWRPTTPRRWKSAPQSMRLAVTGLLRIQFPGQPPAGPASVGANGEGDTPEAAIADLREAVEGLIAEFGAPQELTLTVEVA
jgi:hypothetical protein